jgi:hypothetical protein
LSGEYYRLEDISHHDTLGDSMKRTKIESARYWLFKYPGPTAWVPGLIIALLVGVLFAELMFSLAAKADPITKTHVQVEHVLEANVQEIPTVPTECLLALKKADIGYSHTYRLVQKNHHLSKHDLRDLNRTLNRETREYKQFRDICTQIANDR